MLTAQVAHHASVPIEELDWYRESEVLALFAGERVSETTLDARREAVVFYADPLSQSEVFSGSDASQLIETFTNSSKELPSDFVKGKTAHGHGVVRGRVRVITREYGDSTTAMKKAMADMAPGDVLVSETTDPDLLEAFKKASAVVTNVGGMLSHAAITSRELNIPCIVGTGVATRILKNGDLVEVDADKGTVRILKEAK
jgi:phosphoenolpyruvate synthase/pyruvate phosphate dikinase